MMSKRLPKRLVCYCITKDPDNGSISFRFIGGKFDGCTIIRPDEKEFLKFLSALKRSGYSVSDQLFHFVEEMAGAT